MLKDFVEQLNICQVLVYSEDPVGVSAAIRKARNLAYEEFLERKVDERDNLVLVFSAVNHLLTNLEFEDEIEDSHKAYSLLCFVEKTFYQTEVGFPLARHPIPYRSTETLAYYLKKSLELVRGWQSKGHVVIQLQTEYVAHILSVCHVVTHVCPWLGFKFLFQWLREGDKHSIQDHIEAVEVFIINIEKDIKVESLEKSDVFSPDNRVAPTPKIKPEDLPAKKRERIMKELQEIESRKEELSRKQQELSNRSIKLWDELMYLDR